MRPWASFSRSRPFDFSKEAVLANGRTIIGLCDEARVSYDYVLVSVVTPRQIVRTEARERLSPAYYEVYVSTPVEICRRRDTKGLYARADRGELHDLIGVSPVSPFETPRDPDLILDTSRESEDESAARLINALRRWEANGLDAVSPSGKQR